MPPALSTSAHRLQWVPRRTPMTTTRRIHPFPYDPFQQRAIACIDQGLSLFVAAPTGSGKTVLADYVIERSFERHQRVIYTAPVKALSNQKFRDFAARYNKPGGIIPPPAGRPEGPPTSRWDVGAASSHPQGGGGMAGGGPPPPPGPP